MGWLRKKAKQIGNVFKKIGKKLKKGLGKVAKAFGKLGPLGSLALSFILPGLGSAIGGWLSGPTSGIFGTIFNGIKTAASAVGGAVKGAFGSVWNTVSGAIEGGLNKIGNVFSKGSDIGTGLKNWVTEIVTGETPLDGDVASGAVKGGDVSSGIVPDGVVDVSDGFEIVDGKAVAKEVAKESKDSIFTTLKNKDISLKERIKTSAEINAAEEAQEAQEAFLAERKSDYFKGQASIQQSSLQQQNFSSSQDTPQFVDFSNFNPQEDPAGQYLAYRGIQGNINPVDVGGYGFDYEAFLRAQLGGGKNYAYF